MSSRAIYVDTSAYLTVLLHEKGYEKIQSRLAKHPLCASLVMFIEAERNVIRLARERILVQEDYLAALHRIKTDIELFLVLDLNFETAMFGQFPTVHLPRTMDLIHLRAAQFFAREMGLEGFLSKDQSQLRAAEELGLPVIR
jgi:hypothetical protein